MLYTDIILGQLDINKASERGGGGAWEMPTDGSQIEASLGYLVYHKTENRPKALLFHKADC